MLLLGGTLPVAAQPKFNKVHGIYKNRFTLKVTKSNSKAEVHYTTDSSEPTADSPVFPNSTIVQSTVVVRAAEFVNGERTSDITTVSYIFPESVLKQSNTPAGYPSTWGKFTSISGTAPADYEMDPELTGDSKLASKIKEGFNTLPILSIVTDKENLFNKTKDEQTGGIYIYTGTSDGLYIHVFLNGMYWGMYNLSERIEDNYCKYHFGGKKADYDVIKREDNLEANEGTLDKWNEMMRLSERASDQKYYRMIVGEQPVSDGREPEVFVDVDNLIDYMLINQYIGNGDWDHHNWIAFRNRENFLQGFRFICWDSENSFNSASTNVLDVNNRDCPTYLFLNLMKNRVFQHRYIDRAWKHLSPGGLLSEAKAQDLWDSLYSVIQTAVYDESARWGDYRRDVHPYSSKGELYTVDKHYLTERSRLLKDFFPKRTANLISQLKQKGWYATVEPPRFLINGEEDASRDTLTWDDELTLLWDTSANGNLSPTAKTFSKENLMSKLDGQDGWVTVKTACKTATAWSPTIERRFYITGGSGIDFAKADDGQTTDRSVYDLSGRRIPNADWHRPGIYVSQGRKIAVK